MKRFACFFAVLCIALTQVMAPVLFCVPITSAAADGGMGIGSGSWEGVNWSLKMITTEKGAAGSVVSSKQNCGCRFELTISKAADGDGVIPSLNGESSIAPWLRTDGDLGDAKTALRNEYGVSPTLINVIIKDGVVSVGDYVFNRHSFTDYSVDYYYVSFGNTLTTIGKYAFLGGISILPDRNVVDLPSSVTTVKAGAFKDTKIENLSLSAVSVSPTAFENAEITNLTFNGETVPADLIKGNTTLSYLELGPNVKTIGANAFSGCTALKTIAGGENVSYIDENAFSGCTSLASYQFSPKLKMIGNSAFSGCKLLTSFELTEDSILESIGSNAFNGCEIIKIVLPPSIKSIGENAFYYGSRIAVAFIPDSSIAMASNALYSAKTILKYKISGGEVNITEIAAGTGLTLSEKSVNLSDKTVLGNPIVSVVKNYRRYVKVCSAHTDQSYDEDGCCRICDYGCKHSSTTWLWENNKHTKKCNDCGEVVVTGNCSGGMATCQSKAVCSFCGNKYGSIGTHNRDKTIGGVPATCEEAGSTLGYACSVCGTVMVKSDVIEPLGHKFTSYVTDQKVTCLQNGSETRTCTQCGKKETKTVKAPGHKWELILNHDATCTEDGTQTYICTRCGEKETVTDTGSALGHSFTNYVSNNNSTCTSDGTKTAKCDRCSVTDTVTDVGTKLGHTYTAYTITVNATCTKDGTKTARCDRCRLMSTITVPKLGHSFTKYYSNNDATCAEDGTKTSRCDRCNVNDIIADVGSKGHSFTNYISDNNATCTTDCTETAKCDRCDAKDTRIRFYGSKLGHSFADYVSNNDATCIEDGTKTSECTRCGETKTISDVGSAKGHTFALMWEYDDKFHWHECSDCGEKGDIAGHTPNSGTVDPETGAKIFRCTDCGVVTGQESSVLLGDVNGDGKINNTDIIMLGRAYMAGEGAKYLNVADMNGDKQINNADIIMLGRLYMSSSG